MSRKIGAQGEKVAAAFLEKKGYQIITTNFYSRYGEIDIIAKKRIVTNTVAKNPTEETFLIFCEVKHYQSKSRVHPLERIDRAKQKKICITATTFLQNTDIDYDTCRFDVVLVQSGWVIDHVIGVSMH